MGEGGGGNGGGSGGRGLGSGMFPCGGLPTFGIFGVQGVMGSGSRVWGFELRV
jgi:hypothetical protein